MAKELRCVLLPSAVALGLAIVIPLANLLVALHFAEGGTFAEFVAGIATFAFFGCLLSITTLPFGVEFLHKTFPLLLTQPIPRAQIWKDKLIAASITVAVPILILALGSWVAQSAAHFVLRKGGVVYGLNRPSEIALYALALLLPTLGSAGYWTILARSTLGGMVFAAFSQLLAFGILAFVVEHFGISEYRLGIRDLSAQTAIFALAGIIYSGIFFRLSWRKLARLELSHISPGDSGGAKSLTARPSRLSWLRCSPTSGLRNLVRKEIQLQRPLFIIATILLVLWVLSYARLLLHPTGKTFPEIVFALTIGFYIPLMSLLAGSVSLGEEKNLAIVGWHLTFPVSIWRQWSVKLAVGLGAWLLLGFLLPFCLTRVGVLLSGPRSFSEIELESWLGIALFMTGVFALSFWAMTLFSNTVRAVIGGLVAVMALGGAGTLAYWLLVEFVFTQPLVRTLLVYDTHWRSVDGWILLGASTVVVGLVQSLLEFRRLQTSPKTIVRYSCALLAFVFLGTLCYFSLLPFTQLTPAIYLLLFMLLLIIIRSRIAPVAKGADS
jgi:hypothetical protein